MLAKGAGLAVRVGTGREGVLREERTYAKALRWEELTLLHPQPPSIFQKHQALSYLRTFALFPQSEMPLPPALPHTWLLLIFQVSAEMRVLAQLFMTTLTKYIPSLILYPFTLLFPS